MWDYLGKQPAIMWGKKFEPVAAEIYSRRTASVVHEFGLLLHPGMPGFGASPDGITSDGVMLEIKCPYSRRLYPGVVPRAYMAQIQGQLDSAGLDMCDYFEVRQGEYRGEEDFLADGADGGDSANGADICADDADTINGTTTSRGGGCGADGAVTKECLTASGLEKGAMFLAGGAEGDSWEVCPRTDDARAAVEWVRRRKQEDPGGRATFWHLVDSNLVRVSRDRGFMEGVRGLVEECRAILTTRALEKTTRQEEGPRREATTADKRAPTNADGAGAGFGATSSPDAEVYSGGSPARVRLPSFAFFL
jgi:hypothetical protein